MKTHHHKFAALLLLGGFFSFYSGPGFAQAPPCVSPPSGLVAWWPGDGNTKDIIGGNNGTLMNGATYAPGMVGQAFSFDGADDYISVPNIVNNWAEGTVEAWINFNDPTPSDSGNYLFSAGGTILGIHKAAGNDLRFGIYDAFEGWQWAGSGVVPNAGQWYHVAATWGSAGIKIYVDGVLSGTNPYTGPSYNSSFNMLGASNFAGSTVNALIDEFGVFNRALDIAEIEAIHAAGAGGKCKPQCVTPPSGLIGWWSGDGNASDIMGTNHGTLNGATFAPGLVGQAFSFDGVDDYVEVPHSDSLNLTGGLTLESWFMLRSAGYATLFSKSDANGSESVTSYGIQIVPDGSINVSLYGTYPADNWTSAAGLVTTGQWYHVALTWDGTYGPADNVKLYLNGALVQTWTKSPAPLTVTSQTLTLGSMKPPTYYGHMDGLIDEAGIFNRALSDSEIQGIYNAGSAGQCKRVIYVSSFGNHTVEQFDPNGNPSLFAANNLSAPSGLAFDPSGNLFVANIGTNTITKFDSNGNGALFSSTGLNSPYALAFDQAGNLYAANFGDSTIEKFDSSGNATVFANSGLNQPVGLAFDSNGILYASNVGDRTITKFDAAGNPTLFSNSPTLQDPHGLAFDASGNLFVANTAYNNIVKLDPAGNAVVFANYAFLEGPFGLAFDTVGQLYVVSENGHAIFRFDPAGNYTGFAFEGTVSPLFIAIQPGTVPPPTPVDRQFMNISTRTWVGMDDNVTIGGFIIKEDPVNSVTKRPRANVVNTKRVLIRGLGSSLNVSGVPIPGRVADPTLTLHDASGAVIATNDNWGDAANAAEISATGLAPTDANESAILITLNSVAGYTAILRGKDYTTGIGLVEIYDLDPMSDTHLLNISTRAFVSVNDDVLIGGVIIQGGNANQVLCRAIGPSMTQFNVSNPLLDPQLDIYDADGTVVAHNDNWKEEPDGTPDAVREAAITATGLAPTDDREAAILTTPPPGSYTAVVRGVGGTTGVGLVEAYRLGPPPP